GRDPHRPGHAHSRSPGLVLPRPSRGARGRPRGPSAGPGLARHGLPSAPAYREAATGITRALAERYGDHPALALWHVHNEYGAPVGESFSTFAQEAFRRWALERHGSLDGVDAAWGTAFWGQVFGEPEDIHAPLPTPSMQNPSLEL